jgi:hypothetical protein
MAYGTALTPQPPDDDRHDPREIPTQHPDRSGYSHTARETLPLANIGIYRGEFARWLVDRGIVTDEVSE